MRAYRQKYPGLDEYKYIQDPTYTVPNKEFKLVPLGDNLSNDDIYNVEIKAPDDNFKLVVYETRLHDRWELWLTMRADYKNYFTFLVRNSKINEATFLTETTHRPEFHVVTNKTTLVSSIRIYDSKLDRRFIKQTCIVDFNEKTLMYLQPMIRSN